MKKRIGKGIILLIILAIMGSFTVYGGVSEGTANALNILGLVQGSDGDYHVADSLTRAEAVTLILRLTNTEEVVPENPGFSDVAETDWFYEAVAISSELGIVNGYPDGSFKPADTVSRQAFLKMMLEVLGYNYNGDYTWNGIGDFSEKVGLVNKEIEPVEFVRKDAFDIMVSLLNANYNRSATKYIYKMLDDELITDQQLESYLDEYELEPYRIESVKFPGQNKVVATINHRVGGTYENVSVWLIDENLKGNINSSFSLTGEQVVITSEEMVEGERYKILIQGFVDSYGNNVPQLEKEFVYSMDYSDYELYLEKIEFGGTKHIELTFTNELSEDSFDSGNYRVEVNDSREYVSAEKLSDTKVLLVIGSELEIGDQVAVTVLGKVKDIYGYEFMDGFTITEELGVEEELQSELSVESVTSIGNGVIQVTFNQNVDPKDAMNEDNYELKDLSEGTSYQSSKNVVASGVDELKYRQYDVVFDRMIDENVYYLKTMNVDSFGGGYALDSQKYQFVYDETSITLSLSSVQTLDMHHFIATFSQPIGEDALAKSKFEISGDTVQGKHVDEDNMYKVHFYGGSRIEEKTSYTLSIKNLTSEYKMTLSSVAKSISSGEVERGAIEVTKKVLSSGDYLLSFNRLINNFVSKENVNLVIYNENGSVINLDENTFTILALDEIIIQKEELPANTEEVAFKGVYLYGDSYYIGEIEVELE